ncbi:hypothetical protein [Pedobacter sp.]|uniref:hypothetical protein n=1 Tax=Pedobacter sp. TaxID=1411316 RepID=UPI003D7FE157
MQQLGALDEEMPKLCIFILGIIIAYFEPELQKTIAVAQIAQQLRLIYIIND